MKITRTSATKFDARQIATFVDSIKLYRHDNGGKVDSEVAKLIDNLPSKYMILSSMNEAELSLLHRSVGYIWRKITGKRISETESEPYDVSNAPDGCYWLLPGGLMLHGLNHFSAAKNNRDVICSMLNINPFIFEHKVNANPDGLVGLIVSRGGVRVLVKRNGSSVYMQTNEQSWPWARDKADKMYHKNRIIKVVGGSEDYKGWKSGVSIILKRHQSEL